MTALTGAVAPELIVLVAGALVAGVVQGISGFAFAMVAMSIWIWRIDPREAVVMAVFGGLCGQIVGALVFRRLAPARDFAPFVIGGLCGVPLGAWLLPRIGVGSFRLILGTVLVIGCPLMLLSRRTARLPAAGPVADGASGFAGGVIGGLSGFTGIAPAIWCTLRGYDKASQRSLLQAFNLATLAATFVALVWNGSLTREMVPRLGIVALAVVVPVLVGVQIYGRLSDAAFRGLVLVLLTLSGAAIVLSAIPILTA